MGKSNQLEISQPMDTRFSPRRIIFTQPFTALWHLGSDKVWPHEPHYCFYCRDVNEDTECQGPDEKFTVGFGIRTSCAVLKSNWVILSDNH